jgi:predicted nucleic acid-binding protein
VGVPATLVDSNVLIDVLDRDLQWEAWSHQAMVEALEHGALFVNPIVYAEISIGFTTAEACDLALSKRWVERIPLPWPASFLAGKAFLEYRRRGGARPSPLPDFFIGAHAVVGRHRLLTRDPTRYRTYFPTVELIAPEQGLRRS